MASVLFTIEIEIKPYLKKFLLHKSVNKKEPLRFPRKHDYNVMLWRQVTNYNKLTNIPVEDRENVINYFKKSMQTDSNQSVAIILPFNDRKDVRSYNYLSVRSKKKFRKEVRIDFNYEFSRFLFHRLKRGKSRLEIVKIFMAHYHMTEEDIKTETLYRYSSRLLEDL